MALVIVRADYTSSKLLNRMAQKQPRDPMVIVKMVKVPMKEVHITEYAWPFCGHSHVEEIFENCCDDL